MDKFGNLIPGFLFVVTCSRRLTGANLIFDILPKIVWWKHIVGNHVFSDISFQTFCADSYGGEPIAIIVLPIIFPST